MKSLRKPASTAINRCVPIRQDQAAAAGGPDPMEPAAGTWEPRQLVLMDASTAHPIEGFGVPLRKPRKTPRTIYKLQLNLGLMGPRLRAYAERQKTSMAAVMRRATQRMLDAEGVPGETAAEAEPFEHSARNVHFHLNLPAACAAELTARARAADMTRGEFVWSLLRGISPAALPPDHGAAVQALMRSTDCIAAMSTDVGEFLRLLSRGAATQPQVEPYRASIRSLDQVVREHLKVASVLIDELRPYRRARW
jgi:hypothetical protein